MEKDSRKVWKGGRGGCQQVRGGGRSRRAQEGSKGSGAASTYGGGGGGEPGRGGLERKGRGLNEGWLWGGYSQVQGVGRPSEGRDGRRRELTCTDLRLEPILQPGDQRGQDVHAQENHLQRQTAGSRQRPMRGSAPSPASCRHAPASLAQTQPGSPRSADPRVKVGIRKKAALVRKGGLQS